MTFLDFCNEFIIHKSLCDKDVKKWTEHRIASFCVFAYRNRFYSKNLFFEESKNHKSIFFRNPKVVITNEIEQLMFDKIFNGYLREDYLIKYQKSLQDALVKPFTYFRENMNQKAYPKDYEV